MKKVIALLLSILMLASLASFSAFADNKPVKIKFAYVPPELTRDECLETNIAFAFKDYLEENFPGRFDVQTFPAGQLGSFPETYAGCSDGSIEIALVNISAIATVDTDLNVWQIPGSVGTLAEMRALLTNDAAMATFDKVSAQTGTTILMGFTAGARHFTNNVREVKTPDEMNGIVFRTMENPLYVKMVESMGAVAVPMASSEMFSALQNKVIEGQENPIASIINDMTYQVQDFITLDGHVYSVAFMVCNTPWLESLDPELQEGIRAAAQVAFEASNEFVDKSETQGLEFLREQGMQVYIPTAEELAQWNEACYNGSIEYMTEQIGEEVIADFMAIVDSLEY